MGRHGLPLLILVSLSLGCATLNLQGSGSADGRIVRPEAVADYDVLVGELAIQEGRLGDAHEAFQRAVAKDPESAFLHRRLGRLSAQLEDIDAAVSHANRAFELDPDSEEVRLFLGRLHRVRREVEQAEAVLRDESGAPFSSRCGVLLYQIYMERNRFEDALALALSAVNQNPGSLEGHMGLATVYERMGQRDDAERALRSALEFHPDRFVLFSRLARMRRAAGDREGEIAIYDEVLATSPDHYGTLVSLGEAQVAIEDLEGAVETYRSVVRIYPGDLQSIRRLASLEFAADRPGVAADVLRSALVRHPEHYELAHSLGQVLRGIDDQEGAREAFGRVPPEHPIYLDSRLQIANILEEAGSFDEAVTEVERVREISPSRALDFHLAGLRARAGDFDGGAALLEVLRAESPDDSEVLYQLGVLYGLARRMDEAIEYMLAALEIDPDKPQALNFIGYTWAERGENLDEAEKMILRALEQRPEDGFITDSLGWVYYMRARPLLRTGRVEEGVKLLNLARERLSQAAELTGGDPVVSEHLGDVHLLLDNRVQALENYREAVALEPRADEQPNLLEKLEELRRELEGP